MTSHSPESLLDLRPKIQLYNWEDVPKYQQDNPYITDGYRAYLSAKQCCKSMLLKSNELFNIWTHGIAFLWFLLLCFYDQLFLLPPIRTSIYDHLIFFAFSLCTQICMLCSTLYHTFNCHVHESVARRWYAADIIGIVVAMMGCYVLGLYYGFYCLKSLQAVYVSVVGILMLVSCLLMAHPKYLDESWRTARIVHLSLISLSGIWPTIHWSVSVEALEIKMFLSDIIVFYAILGVATVVYLLKYPEKCMPGRFNTIGQSHNLWHILVVIALLHWRSFALRVLRYRISTTCTETSIV